MSRTEGQPRRRRPPRRWWSRFLLLLLLVSVAANFYFYLSWRQYFERNHSPRERFYSGSQAAEAKIAIVRVTGTIMPPFTSRVLATLRRVKDDPAVKGVLLVVDSPGGLVADSHQIYHRLQELREDGKTIYVAMKRMAASGGYYISMGCGPDGRIFAEPTTWTGSIGVIIPRYDVGELADSWGVKSDPLKTGKFKDALNPFRSMRPDERALWAGILNESFERFLEVIDENRTTVIRRDRAAAVAQVDPSVIPHSLELVTVKDRKLVDGDLATGRIFPATEALERGLIDEIGFEDDALAALQEKLQLKDARVVEYVHPQSLLEMALGAADATDPEEQRRQTLDASIPQAMYYFSWVPPSLPLPKLP